MKVLILGASGFIALPVAQAFVRNGHEVIGQTRSAEKAKLLVTEEIIPLIADPKDGDSWKEAAAKADVVIDCIGGYEIKVLSKYLFEVACEAAKSARGPGAPKMTYIYTSGTWIHGHDPINLTSERSPVKNTVALVNWRPEHEERVINSTVVNGIVLRSSLAFGRSEANSVVGSIFNIASKGENFEWAGRKGGRYAFIHVDDMADMFLRVAEAGPICKGLIFDAANDFSESVDDILTKVCEITNVPTWKYREPENVLEEAYATVHLLRPSLARSLVGWYPKKAGLVDGMHLYYATWKATRKQSEQ